MTFSPYSGTTNSNSDSSYQLAFYNQTGINGSGIPGLKIRKGIDTTWNSWYKIYTDGDFTQSNIDNWNTAYGWGDYRQFGLGRPNELPASDLNSVTYTSILGINDNTTNKPFGYGSVWTHRKSDVEY